jgi:cytidylate kinase
MGSSDTSLLQQRMTNRGDSPQKVIERTQLVKKDTLDLSRQSEKFRPQDKLFVIKSDETLYQEVIPWVIRVLGIRVV